MTRTISLSSNLNGIRLILSKFDNQIKLYTRHNNVVTSKFPELLNLDISDGTVLEGEVIVAAAGGALKLLSVFKYKCLIIIYIETNKNTWVNMKCDFPYFFFCSA